MPGDKLVWRVDKDGQLREGSPSPHLPVPDVDEIRHLVQEVLDFVRAKQVRDVYSNPASKVFICRKK